MRARLITFVQALLLASPAWGMPPRPGSVTAGPKRGPVDVKVRRIDEIKPICTSAPPPATALSGEHRLLVVLVETADQPWPEGHAKGRYEELIFDRGSSSVREYYREVSYGQFTVAGEVVGPVRIPGKMADYAYARNGGDNAAVQKLLGHAVSAAAKHIDPASFDTHDQRGQKVKDGILDHLLVIYAEATGAPDGFSPIWPHRGTTDLALGKGQRLASYMILNHAARLGVYVHELGHDLGVPDLYDRDYSSHGAGDWCTMASGSWLGDAERPVHLSAWAKQRLGWINPEVVSKPVKGLAVPSSSERPFALKIPIGEVDSPEYFLVENRRRVGFDRSLPAEGLLVWHIDERRGDNDEEAHKMVDVMEASRIQDLDSLDERASPDYRADLYTRVGQRLADDTEPSARSYDGSLSHIRLTLASGPERVMRVDVERPPVFHPGGVPFALSLDNWSYGRFATVPLGPGAEALVRLEATPGGYFAYGAEAFVAGKAKAPVQATFRVYADDKGQPGRVQKTAKHAFTLGPDGFGFARVRLAESDKGLAFAAKQSFWVGVELSVAGAGVALNPFSTSKRARWRKKASGPVESTFRFQDRGVVPVDDYVIRVSGFGYLEGPARPAPRAAEDDPLVARLRAADRLADQEKRAEAFAEYEAVRGLMEKDPYRYEGWWPAVVAGAGVMAYELGRWPEAIERFEASLRRAEEAADPPTIADLRENLAETAFAAGQLERAHEEAERSFAINEPLGRADRLVENCYWSARALDELGKKPEAEARYADAERWVSRAFAKDATAEADYKRRIAAARAGSPQDRPGVRARGEELAEKSKNKKQKVQYTDLLQFLADDAADGEGEGGEAP